MVLFSNHLLIFGLIKIFTRQLFSINIIINAFTAGVNNAINALLI